ncbi:MAG: DUF5672 family protein [Betaproteobacteria bacterium]
MLALPQVTLCCVDTANHALALRALARSTADIAFGRVLFLTHGTPEDLPVPPGIDVIDIGALRSREEYSEFVLKKLVQHIATDHVLLMQWDGFVVNWEAWDPAFAACDYLGAKWFWYDDGMRVGNGGFSLRSRRLLEALQDPRITLTEAEDLTIARSFRPLLERDHGIRFGTEDVADRFAFEAAYPIGKPFGFHGLFNFCRVLPQREIVAMVPAFSDAIAQSLQLGQLMRNCAAMGQWDAVRAISARVLTAQPADAEAKVMLERAQATLERPQAVGRNDPCPCGSGRKYKQCHGALTAGISAPRAGTAAEVEAAVAQAMAAHQGGDLAAAEMGYQQALYWSPEQPVAMHYLGVIHYQRGQLAAALPLLEYAATKMPHEPEFHNNLGLALAAADREAEAIAAYRRTLALKPGHALAWNNLGLVLQACNRLADAIGAFREAIKLQPQFGQAHWNLALALLCHGEFREGWREYEWRLALKELGQRGTPPAGPRWDGRVTPGTTLLLTCEQGLGDALQFARFAQPLAALGIRVLIQAPAVLRHLLASVPGVAGTVTAEDAMPQYDAYLPMLSVAGALDIDGNSVPNETPYVAADRGRRDTWRGALDRTAGTRKVGLCWTGSALHANDRRRSLPFTALQPLLVEPDVAWISLQKDVTVGDVAAGDIAVGSPLHEWPARNDFDDLAALIAELDLVITVDTSIAHLAGALGRPVWILLSYAPDWRWRLERSDSDWYPAARLFRQSSTGDWNGAVTRVREALQSFRPERR